MAGDKILVLGGTGEAGICLLRELIHRNHPTIVYARNPNKIPADVSASPLIEIIKGEIDEVEKLSTAVSKCKLIISLLGPARLRVKGPTDYADCYRAMFPLMRQHGVRRLFAMGTISIRLPQDQRALSQQLIVWMVQHLVPTVYGNIMAIQKLFEDDAATADIDWTVYRLGLLLGACDEASWAEGRQDDEYAGPIGAPGWRAWQKRGALARWLVDAAESGAPELVRQMPAVSKLNGSKAKTS
jgi:nucleoside-diphosphate-sugar epimerase